MWVERLDQGFRRGLRERRIGRAAQRNDQKASGAAAEINGRAAGLGFERLGKLEERKKE